MELQELCVEQDALIEQALQRLDQTARKILFIVQKGRLIGTLTDGDVRRYLLKGGDLQSSIMHAANLSPKSARSRGQAEHMLQNSELYAVPLVDKDGKLWSILFRDAPKEKHFAVLDLPVIIMAGGKGTRLEPYTKVLPKPLIPVGDTPIIEHIMSEFQQYGCGRFHLIVNHKKQLIKAYFAESCNEIHPTYYDEEKPLGTGGGLYMLKGKIKETFFLTNCDILIKADYGELLRFHREHKNSVTMVCARKNLAIPYGVVETTESGDIWSMKEKPNFSFLTNTGFYVVEPEVLEDIEDNVPIGFPDIIEIERAKGRRTAVFAVDEDDWMDMGQLNELENMREKLYGK